MAKSNFECNICQRVYELESVADFCEQSDLKTAELHKKSFAVFMNRHKHLMVKLNNFLNKFKQDNGFKKEIIKIQTDSQGIILKLDSNEIAKAFLENEDSQKEVITWVNLFALLTANSLMYKDLNEGKVDTETQQPLSPDFIFLVDRFYLESIIINFDSIFSTDPNYKNIKPALVDQYLELKIFERASIIEDLSIDSEGRISFVNSDIFYPTKYNIVVDKSLQSFILSTKPLDEELKLPATPNKEGAVYQDPDKGFCKTFSLSFDINDVLEFIQEAEAKEIEAQMVGSFFKEFKLPVESEGQESEVKGVEIPDSSLQDNSHCVVLGWDLASKDEVQSVVVNVIAEADVFSQDSGEVFLDFGIPSSDEVNQ